MDADSLRWLLGCAETPPPYTVSNIVPQESKGSCGPIFVGAASVALEAVVCILVLTGTSGVFYCKFLC